MADETIVIGVKDEVATGPADKFREMAAEALAAGSAIERLQANIKGLSTTTIGKFASSLDSIARSTKAMTTAQAQSTAENLKAQVQQQRLATELARTSAAEASAALAKLRLQQATEKTTAAVQKQSESEEQASARLLALAKAGVEAAQAQRDQTNAMIDAAAAQNNENNIIGRRIELSAAEVKAYQDATRAARDKLNAQKQSTSGAKSETDSLAQVSKALDDTTKKYKLSRNQILTFQYTASDIVSSLGSGISPLTIALQQGPQVAQVFTKEIGALVSRFGTLIGTVGTVVTVLGILGVAYQQASAESAKLKNSLTITGNQAGLTADSYTEMAKRIAESSNTSISAAKEVANAFISSGQFQRQEIEQNTQSVLTLSKFTGQSADDIEKAFEQMAQAPTAFSEAMNRQFNYLSSAQLTQIRQLEQTGQKTKATELASKLLYDYLGTQGKANVTTLGGAWDSLSRNISNAYDSLKEFVHGPDISQQIANIKTQLAQIEAAKKLSGSQANPSDDYRTKALQDQLGVLEQQQKSEQDAATSAANAVTIQKDGYDASKRISDQWLKTVDNIQGANEQIKAFRNDLNAALKANPNDAAALAAQKAQAQIEAKIRASNSPQGDSRAQALAKINSELDKQIAGFGMLAPARKIQQQLDQYDIDFAARKQSLSATERADLASKLQLIEDNNAAQAESDRIYSETAGPLKTYNATLSAALALLKNGTISQKQYTDELNAAQEKYQDSQDPMREYNIQLAQQEALLTKSAPAREIAQQMQQVENDLRSKGKSITAEETAALQKRLETIQQSTAVQQAYDQIYAQTAGVQRDVSAAVTATNQAYSQGLISMDVYGTKLAALRVQAAQARIDAGTVLPGDAALASFGKVIEGYKGLLSGLSDSFGGVFVSITDGFANAIGGAVAGTETLGDALRNVAQTAVSQLIASLIKLGIQYAINAAIGQAAGASVTASSVALASTTALAWAPAAAAVSLATLGANSAAAVTGMAAANAASLGFAVAGFQDGGWTGPGGVSQVAGVVHGQEYVMPAEATKRIGVANLDAMKDGRSTGVTAGSQANASVGTSSNGAQVNIQVINNSSNSTVSTTQSQDENGNVDFTVSIDTIENALAGRMASGRGALNKATKNAFGLSNVPSGG